MPTTSPRSDWDLVLRADLWRTFAGLAAEGATLLISSHVMDEVHRVTACC